MGVLLKWAIALPLAIGVCACTTQGMKASASASAQSPIATASHPVGRRVIWSKAIDAPNPAETLPWSLVAVNSGIVAFAEGNALCGHAEKTGARIWCITSGSVPTAAVGGFAFLKGRFDVDVIEATTGRTLFAYTFPTTKLTGRSAGVNFIVATDKQVVAGAFLAPSPNKIAVLQPSRRPIVSAASCCAFGRPIVAAGYLIALTSGSGATIQYDATVYHFGPPFALVGSIPDVTDVLQIRNNIVYGLALPMTAAPNAFLYADLVAADLRNLAAKTNYHLSPEHDLNFNQYVKESSSGGSYERGRVALAWPYVYFQIVDKIYRYRLPDASHPRLVSNDGTFVAGPIDDKLFVARSDGLWGIDAASTRAKSERLIPEDSPLKVIAFAGNQGFAAFADGSIYAFALDSRHSELIASLPGVVAQQLVPSRDELFVVSDSPSWAISAVKL